MKINSKLIIKFRRIKMTKLLNMLIISTSKLNKKKLFIRVNKLNKINNLLLQLKASYKLIKLFYKTDQYNQNLMNKIKNATRAKIMNL